VNKQHGNHYGSVAVAVLRGGRMQDRNKKGYASKKMTSLQCD